MSQESQRPIGQNQRFKQIPVENLTAEQRALADAIRSGPRGAVKNSAAARPGPLGGPFNVFLRSPEIGNIVQSLGAAIRFKSSIPPKLNELAIITTARQWTAQYEWIAHHRLALEAGLDPAIGERGVMDLIAVTAATCWCRGAQPGQRAAATAEEVSCYAPPRLSGSPD